MTILNQQTISMSNSISNSQSDNLAPSSQKTNGNMSNILDDVEEVSSPVIEFPLANIIQIIKLDGTVISSYHTLSPLHDVKIQHIRSEVIDYSRKLYTEAYENDITQILVKSAYVYFRARKGVILYVVSRSSYSYTIAEDFMNKILMIYDESIFQIFGQHKLPKNISQAHLIKLQTINKKICNLVKQMTNSRSTRGTSMSRKTQNFVRSISSGSLDIHNRAQSQKHIQKQNQEILKSSIELRSEAKKLNVWMVCKKYLLFVFLMATLMISAYLFSIYY